MVNRKALALAALTAAAIATGAACTPPPVHSPGLALPVLPTWSRSAQPAIYLVPGAKPWCGAFAKVAYGTTGGAFPCDAGTYSEADAIGTFRVTRTRVDVDLSSLSRGKAWDLSLADSLRAECDDAGGEMIAHLDGNGIVGAVDCEDVDY
jgi:hypothetical protein